jgi:UDP-3-O-[3-hydroxymyristoyl] glucosamine N-acyltransferase
MFTIKQINQLISGELVGNPDTVITGPAKIEEGVAGCISFLANPKYEHFIYTTQSSAVIVGKDFEPSHKVNAALIKVANVYESLGKLLHFYNSQISFPKGKSSLAFISEKSTIGENVGIDHYVVINDGASVGENSILFAHVYIGQNVTIGKNCILYSGVKIYHNCVLGDNVIIHANTVIGSDGFGFSNNEETGYNKIPQIGNVVIEDNVEIGSSTVIDRASMGSTFIRKGVKLDNLIQIAHNVEIGEKTAIAAQTGIAGSTKIGKRCIIGGQVGIAGHITMADGTMIQAKSGISSSIKEENSKLYGYPALDYNQYLKSYAYFKKLPEMADKIRELELVIQKLKESNE